MNVKLINKPDIEPCRIAAACSTGKIGQPNNSLGNALQSGHLSVLEHVYFSFLIQGISRSCSHQLVRHRHFSFVQSSQRYCTIDTSSDWYVIPPGVDADMVLYHKYCSEMNNIGKAYNAMLDAGITPEDARYVLPNATTTDIVASMNGRALVEAAQLRMCQKAQLEIRTLFNQMELAIRDICPVVAELMCPPCEFGKCKEARPCQKGQKNILQ